MAEQWLAHDKRDADRYSSGLLDSGKNSVDNLLNEIKIGKDWFSGFK